MKCRHPKAPEGYLEWHAWAEQMSKRFVQKPCPKCGKLVWRKKNRMTTELLQRIAKCAPPEMGAKFYKGRSSNTPSRVMFNNVFWQHPLCQVAGVVELFATDDPYVNSQGCEAMLDAMEREGVAAYVGAMIDEDGVRLPGFECAYYDTNEMVGGEVEQCPTRAIATGEAFCKVFEGLI